MTNGNTLRLGGLLGVVAAGLLIAALAFLMTGNPLVGQALYFVACPLLVLAVVSLYAAQSERMGTMGLTGLVLSVVGSTFTTVNTFLWVPAFAGVPEAHAVLMFAWGTIYLVHFTVLALSTGFILLGLATFRAGLLPGWAGLVLALGAAVYAAGELWLPMVNLAGIVLIAAAFAWLGFAIWSYGGQTARRAGGTP